MMGCASDRVDLCGPAASAPAAPFADATEELGIDFVHHVGAQGFCGVIDEHSPGACLFDYDGDGDLDAYFVDRAPYPNRLYRNDGATFSDVTEESGAGDTSDSVGCLAFDADGDGDIDLFVANNGPDRLLRNDHGHFTDVTDEIGLVTSGMSSSATAGDIDGDGDLDLVVGRFVDPSTCPPAECVFSPTKCKPLRTLIFENRGGRFVEVGVDRGVTPEEPTLATLLFDFDSDGDLDLYLGNDLGNEYPDRLYINDGSGHFEDRAVEVGLAALGTDTMGIDVGNYGEDGSIDIVMSDFLTKPTKLFRCAGAPMTCAMDDLGPSSTPYLKWGIKFADFDQDGDLDLFTASGNFSVVDAERDQRNQLYWNENGGFKEHVFGDGDALGMAANSRGAVTGDIDGDGDVDVLIAHGGQRPQILRNQAASGHWLTASLDSMSVGARVTVTAAGRKMTRELQIGGSYLGSGDPRLHFGLGAACSADVRVRWLDGRERRFTAVPADQVLKVDPP